jgi:small subunit ribosomal protein S6
MAKINEEKLYELAYLASPDLDEAGIAEIKNTVDTSIVKLGGSIREQLEVSKKKLAYPIKKFSSAHFVSELINLSPNGKKELEKEMKFNHSILRYIFILMTDKVIARMRERKAAPVAAVARKATEEKFQAKVKAEDKPEKSEAEKKADIAEIEKKLDEILGREI